MSKYHYSINELTLDDLERLATRRRVRPDEIVAAAPRQREILEALKLIKKKDKDAEGHDGEGFSMYDIKLGHALANLETLTPRTAALARRLVYRYRRQVPFILLAKIFGDVSLKDLEGKMKGPKPVPEKLPPRSRRRSLPPNRRRGRRDRVRVGRRVIFVRRKV